MRMRIDGRRSGWLLAVALTIIVAGGAPCRADNGGSSELDVSVGNLKLVARADVDDPTQWNVFGPADNVFFSSGPNHYFYLVNLDTVNNQTFVYSWTFTLETKAQGTLLYGTQDSSGNSNVSWGATPGQQLPTTNALLFDLWANPGAGGWHTRTTTTVTSGSTFTYADHEHDWAHF